MTCLHPSCRSGLGKLVAAGVFIALWAINAAAQNSYSGNEIKPIDRILAIVNEDVITQQEINELLQNTIQQLQKQDTQLPRMDVLEKQLLEHQIIKRIQLQRAKEIGLRRWMNSVRCFYRRAPMSMRFGKKSAMKS